MLTHLCIRNYVLIKELDIDWHDGFSADVLIMNKDLKLDMIIHRGKVIKK